MSWLDGMLKTAIMTPLEERVANLNVCTHCHTKTLVEKHECDAGRFAQCSTCLRVFVLNPLPTGDSNE